MTHTHSAISVLALALSLATMAVFPALAAEKSGTVTATILNVRAKPGRQGECVAKLKQGDQIKVLASRDGWLEVRLPVSAKAWVAAKHLDDTGTVTVSKLRVHVGPGIIYSVYSFVDQGVKVKCLGPPLGEWQKIEPPINATGWVAEAYVKFDSDDGVVESTAAEEAAPTECTVVEITDVYAEPSKRFDAIGTVQADGKVEVFKVDGDWCQIRLPASCRAWIRANALDEEGRTSVDDASILAIPGIANTMLSPVRRGEKFERVGDPVDAWQMVVPPPQARGWIATASVTGLGTPSEDAAKKQRAAAQAEKAKAEAKALALAAAQAEKAKAEAEAEAERVLAAAATAGMPAIVETTPGGVETVDVPVAVARAEEQGIVFPLEEITTTKATHALYHKEGERFRLFCLLRSDSIDLADWIRQEVWLSGVHAGTDENGRRVVEVKSIQLLDVR